MSEDQTVTTETAEDAGTTEQEAWMKTDQDPDSVPVSTHIRVKQKLKGKLHEKDDELMRLQQEIDALKQQQSRPAPVAAAPSASVPLPDDFDDPQDYQAAFAKYQADLMQENISRVTAQQQQQTAQQQHQAAMKQAVNAHYERASALVADTGIKPEIYQQADKIVRQSVENIMPRMGDVVTDQLISNLGDGSEKTMYYLGNNSAELAQFTSLLAEDQSGLKAAMYLGQLKAKLTNPSQPRSAAPAPAPELGGGDANVSLPAGDAKRKYDAAHKKGDMQSAIRTKLAAKRAGVDVSGW